MPVFAAAHDASRGDCCRPSPAGHLPTTCPPLTPRACLPMQVVLVRLDHMHDRQLYMRTLAAWAKDLRLTGTGV